MEPFQESVIEDLQDLEIEHVKRFKDAFAHARSSSWVHYFPFLYCFSNKKTKRLLFSVENGSLCVFLHSFSRKHPDRDRLALYFPPVPMDPDALRVSLQRIADFNKDRSTNRIIWIEADEVDALSDVSGFSINTAFKEEEYLYDPQHFTEFSGKKFTRIRRQWNQISKVPNLEIMPYQKEYRGECLAMLEAWESQHGSKYDELGDRVYTRRCLELYDRFPGEDLSGLIFRIDGQIKSFSFFGMMYEDVANWFIMKTDHSIAALNMFASCYTLRTLASARIVNFASDLGQSGLKFAKESLHPCSMLKIFSATVEAAPSTNVPKEFGQPRPAPETEAIITPSTIHDADISAGSPRPLPKELQKLTMEDEALIRSFCAAARKTSYPSCFPFLFCWSQSSRHRLYWEVIDQSLCIYSHSEVAEYGRLSLLMPPFPHRDQALIQSIKRLIAYNPDQHAEILLVAPEEAHDLADEGFTLQAAELENCFRGSGFLPYLEQLPRDPRLSFRPFSPTDEAACLLLLQAEKEAFRRAGGRGFGNAYKRTCIANAGRFQQPGFLGEVMLYDNVIRGVCFAGETSPGYGSLLAAITDPDFAPKKNVQFAHLAATLKLSWYNCPDETTPLAEPLSATVHPAARRRLYRARTAARITPPLHPQDGQVKDINTRIYLRAARELGLSVEVISAQYSYLVISDGARQLFVYHNSTSLTDVATRRMTHNKFISQKIFRDHGIPVPDARSFDSRNESAIIRYALEQLPVVIKPVKGSRSVGVVVDPRSEQAIIQAIRAIAPARLLVEKLIVGDDYRILIHHGKVIDIITWVPPSITGNGIDSIDALIREKNTYFKDHDLYPLVVDPEHLANQQLDLAAVPRTGQRVTLNSRNEHTVGAEAIRIDPGIVHPDNMSMFVKAAKISGLEFAGLDFMSPNPSVSYRQNRAAVNEINSAPHIWPHFFADLREDNTVVKTILSTYFARTEPPVVASAPRHEPRPSELATPPCRNIAGIVRGKWSSQELAYYIEALHYYDEVLYIDPSFVTYCTNRETGQPDIASAGLPLTTLSMLYVFGRIPETQLLAKFLALCGCPLSDPYESIARDGLEKLADSLAVSTSGGGITTHVLTSHQQAEAYLNTLDASYFPLLNKPIRGNKGKGIIALSSVEEAISFSTEHFRSNQEWLVFERLMHFSHEYRIYVVDGKPVEMYEKVRHDDRIVMNLHQGATAQIVADDVRQNLLSWLMDHLPERYHLGVYGIDLATTADGGRYIIEINRTPGFSGLTQLGLLNFPRYVHQVVSGRARRYTSVDPAAEPYLVSFLGDTNPADSYQERLEQQGRGNILQSHGYEFSFGNFTGFLKESNFSIANLEVCITDERESPYAGNKRYLDWTDPSCTPNLLKEMGIHAVSLGNNHTLDFGAKGMAETLDSLAHQGILTFGGGMADHQAAQALHHRFVLNGNQYHLIVAGGYEFHRTNFKRQYYAGPEKAGVNLWSEEKAGQQIATLRREYPEAFIVAFPHWGDNYTYVLERQQLLAATLVAAGADLIIGHGSHMLQEIGYHDGRWIIYGIGNFVYNTPGRFSRHDVLPFGMLCRLMIYPTDLLPVIAVRLYPTHIDNRENGFQSSFATKHQLLKVLNLIMPAWGKRTGMERKLRSGKDQHGYYLAMDLPWKQR